LGGVLKEISQEQRVFDWFFQSARLSVYCQEGCAHSKRNAGSGIPPSLPDDTESIRTRLTD
jgi:hypothetical protein